MSLLLEAIMWPCSFQIQFQKIRPLIFVNIFSFCSFESYVYTWMQIAVAASDILFYDHFKFDLSVLKKIWVLIIAKKTIHLILFWQFQFVKTLGDRFTLMKFPYICDIFH